MNLQKLFTGGPKPIWIRYLLLIGFFFLVTRSILDSQFRHSALLYILVPYCVSIALYFCIPPATHDFNWRSLGRHILAALVVMLATSALLFEGFLCVLMFMPIYILFAIIGFALTPKGTSKKTRKNNKLQSSFIPLIIIVLSLEGVSSTLSLNRDYTVKRSKTVSASITDLKQNLAMPIDLKAKRSRFLSLFPLPDNIQAGSLNPGDIHKANFTYKRWGLTNIQKGQTWLEISEVGDNHVRTRIIKDTSYFSKYLKIKGTLITFEEISEFETTVTLTIEYKRLLDPAWYFGPMQHAAITESADYLIDNVIRRDTPSES